MKSYKEYRFKQNPKEKEFFDTFKKNYENNRDSLGGVIFGWSDERQTTPNNSLSSHEVDICANLIQWLGSPVGQGFLDQCGFTLKKK